MEKGARVQQMKLETNLKYKNILKWFKKKQYLLNIFLSLFIKPNALSTVFFVGVVLHNCSKIFVCVACAYAMG